MPELMPFHTGMSISRYLPPRGTAGLARVLVRTRFTRRYRV